MEKASSIRVHWRPFAVVFSCFLDRLLVAALPRCVLSALRVWIQPRLQFPL